MALGFHRRGIKTIAVSAIEHARDTRRSHSSGRSLHEVCDLAIDTCIPAGDALISIPGLDVPVSPGSTIGGCGVANAIKAEVAQRLTAAGHPPLVLASSHHLGKVGARERFEKTYEDYRKRVGVLYD